MQNAESGESRTVAKSAKRVKTTQICANETRQKWIEGSIRSVQPMMDGTRRVAIRAVQSTNTIWKRLGTKEGCRQSIEAVGEPNHDESVWSDHRIGIVIGLLDYMHAEDRAFWSGRKAPTAPRKTEGLEISAPMAFRVARRFDWIGPWTLQRNIAKGCAMLSGMEMIQVLKSAGWRWHPELGVWTCTNAKNAAATAAFANETLGAMIEEGGTPKGLHPMLRHAPALIPWQETWVLVGKTGSRRGAGRPGLQWREAGANAWATTDFSEARRMADYAPETLEIWLKERNEGSPEEFRTETKNEEDRSRR